MDMFLRVHAHTHYLIYNYMNKFCNSSHPTIVYLAVTVFGVGCSVPLSGIDNYAAKIILAHQFSLVRVLSGLVFVFTLGCFFAVFAVFS